MSINTAHANGGVLIFTGERYVTSGLYVNIKEK